MLKPQKMIILIRQEYLRRWIDLKNYAKSLKFCLKRKSKYKAINFLSLEYKKTSQKTVKKSLEC